MPKMCIFHVPSGDAPIYVNPNVVRMLRPGPGYTNILFDKDHSVNVALPVDEVAHALDIAMNAE